MKIAICTPHYGGVHARFASSLAKMVAKTVQAPIMFNDQVASPEIEIFMKSSSTLATLRSMLVQDAIDWGANYLLWVDSDHSFPADALLRLLSLNLPLVRANYPRRTSPTYPTARDLDGDLLWTTRELAKRCDVVPVGSLGLGFCLMSMTVLDDLRRHAAAQGQENFWPLFAFETRPGEMESVGEDIFFFRKLSAAGIVPHVDHALSWTIGHLHEKLLTNDEAVMRRGEADSSPPQPTAGPPSMSAAPVQVRVAWSGTSGFTRDSASILKRLPDAP